MEKIDFKKQNIPFTQVANAVLNDPTLSAKAKGLYAYLYSKPNDWDFALDRIAKDFSDGRRAIYTAILELEQAGYLQRQKLGSGKTSYYLLAKIDNRVVKPVVENSKLLKQQIAKIDSISNKEEESNKELVGVKNEINQVFKVFYDSINPTINYGNKAYRKAIEDLVGKFGLEKTVRLAEYAVRVHDERYAPAISNPLQLREKYPQLLKFYNSNKPGKKYEYHNENN